MAEMEIIAEKNGLKIGYLGLSPAESFEIIPFEGRQFACLLVNTLKNESGSSACGEEPGIELGKKLILSGCRFVCCAGENCCIWDDTIDWAAIGLEREEDSPYFGVDLGIMTTWHDDDTLDETVDFFIHSIDFDDRNFTERLVLFLGEDIELKSRYEASIRKAINRRELNS